MSQTLQSHIKSKKYYNELYEIPWKHYTNKPKKQSKLHIGIINVPCEGFGDIIVCQTFYEYLKEWYPQHTISVCSTTPLKFRKLGYKTKIYPISVRYGGGLECELPNLHYFKKKDKPKRPFDVMICIPIINYQFEINLFQKFIPYANLFNTFTVSEYNGYLPPYTFPIGVGKGQLGLMLNKQTLPKQTLIEKPYAVAYLQPPDISGGVWGVHCRPCFLSFIEMLASKYRRRHSIFQVVLQQWIITDLDNSAFFKHQFKSIITKHYPNVWTVTEDNVLHLFQGEGATLILRADVLPQPRPMFISLMKHSVEDILVTGDQSITDCLSHCQSKHIWYQIAPWKTDFAIALAKEIPDKHIENFRTSCGVLRGLKPVSYKRLLQTNDFRKLGKERMDAILAFIMCKDKYQPYMDIVLHSRKKESVIQKLKKLKYTLTI